MGLKHFFIINPNAGKKRNTKEIIARICDIFAGRTEPFEIALTERAGHATDLARQAAESGEPTRIYPIGGDGTVHEALAGCYGAENVELAPFPNGTGNDFIKSFPDRDFSDIARLVDGEKKKIDLLRCGKTIAINIINCGFDAMVAKNVEKFKKSFSGVVAYYISLFYTFLSHLGAQMHIELDDEVVYDGGALLAAVANGRVYGGGFIAAPAAKLDDGALDLVIARAMSRLKITSFVDRYKSGKHETLGALLIKGRGKKVRVRSDVPFAICYDGECEMTTDATIEVLPQALTVVLPKQD